MVDSAESGITNESQGQVEQPARVITVLFCFVFVFLSRENSLKILNYALL